MAQQSYLDEFLTLMRTEGTNVIINDQNLRMIRYSVLEWLKMKKQLDRRLFLRYKELQSDKYKVSEPKNAKVSELRRVFNAYIAQQRRIKNLREIEDVAEHFKKGYELIHRIREALTKQDITYTVLYTGNSDVKGENLLEAHLSLSQILPSISVSLSASNISKSSHELTNLIDLKLSNDAIKRTMDALLKDTSSPMQQIVNGLDKPRSLRFFSRI